MAIYTTSIKCIQFKCLIEHPLRIVSVDSSNKGITNNMVTNHKLRPKESINLHLQDKEIKVTLMDKSDTL